VNKNTSELVQNKQKRPPKAPKPMIVPSYKPELLTDTEQFNKLYEPFKNFSKHVEEKPPEEKFSFTPKINDSFARSKINESSALWIQKQNSERHFD
jgi:hypothetical protein